MDFQIFFDFLRIRLIDLQLNAWNHFSDFFHIFYWKDFTLNISQFMTWKGFLLTIGKIHLIQSESTWNLFSSGFNEIIEFSSKLKHFIQFLDENAFCDGYLL